MARDRASSGSNADAGLPPAGALPEMVRRMVALGLSGFFTTEEALRRALGDTIPQEWVDFAAEQSERTRRDFSEAVAREIGRALEDVDLAEMFGKMFENRAVEITARVRLLPIDEGSSKTRFNRVSVEVEDPDAT
jgi:hypothetical protein